jgi:hypothetical protein
MACTIAQLCSQIKNSIALIESTIDGELERDVVCYEAVDSLTDVLNSLTFALEKYNSTQQE